MRYILSAAILATTMAFTPSAQSQVPACYPADYGKLVDAAKKEVKFVIYSTTDAASANPSSRCTPSTGRGRRRRPRRC